MEAKCTSGNHGMILYVLQREVQERITYCGAPHFSYRIGAYTLLRDGRIVAPADEAGVFPTLAAMGLCDYPYDPAPPDAGDIAYPMEGHSGTSLLNLLSIFSARQQLINRALDARGAFYVAPRLMEDLLAHPPVTVADFLQALYGREEEYCGITFSAAYIALPGFRSGRPGERPIHQQLADRILETAQTQRWVKAFTPNVRNKKYAFRTWLNAIGMTGPEYEAARLTMLARLPGRSDQRSIPRRKGD